MLTLCFLYCVFSLVSIFGFLFFTLEIHELIFWCYQLIPAGIALVPIVKQVIKFFFISWMHFMFHIFEVCVYLAFHIFSFLVTLISICMPYLSKPIYVVCSFFKWMYSEIWRGIYMRGNPFLTLLSWIMIMCTFLLCVVQIFLQRTVPRNVQNRQRNDHGHEEDQNDQENENMENRLVEVRQRLLNRQQHNLPVLRTNQNDPIHAEDNPENINLDDNQQLCIICIENVRNFAVFPCGHLHFCRLCVENLFRSRTNVKCPVCNIHIEEYRRIFV